jgi:hypothetical protein
MNASFGYSRGFGSERNLGDFTSAVDWISPLRPCWLSLRNAARIILKRLGAAEEAMPNWSELDSNTDAAFQALARDAVPPPENGD